MAKYQNKGHQLLNLIGSMTQGKAQMVHDDGDDESHEKLEQGARKTRAQHEKASDPSESDMYEASEVGYGNTQKTVQKAMAKDTRQQAYGKKK